MVGFRIDQFHKSKNVHVHDKLNQLCNTLEFEWFRNVITVIVITVITVFGKV